MSVARRSRGPIVVGALVLALVVAHDWGVPVERQFATRAAVYTIERYRQFVSPWIGNFVRCRFQPTCSAYGIAVVKKYGAVRGGWKAVTRVARCNPWTPQGTVDEP